MRFGPLELQACGENNFTMKALGMLAFRDDLARRFIRELLHLPVAETDPVSILYFSRIGEGFFREAIERARRDGSEGVLEARLNAALGLPANFGWSRNANGGLTQPAKWQETHIRSSLDANGRRGDQELEAKLKHLQDCFNTEPDLVLQWRDHLCLIEVKVLSGEGQDQLMRQRDLGFFIGKMLGWQSHFYMIGPDHGSKPSLAHCTFISWSEVRDLFQDIPAIAEYIREFAFFYKGRWQSMVEQHAKPPGETAYDLLLKRATVMPDANSVGTQGAFVHSQPTFVPSGNSPSIGRPGSTADPWHFSHLGRDYFARIRNGARVRDFGPLMYIYTGSTGVPYASKATGRLVNPNWMAESASGERRTNKHGFAKPHEFDPRRMRRWLYKEIAEFFALET